MSFAGFYHSKKTFPVLVFPFFAFLVIMNRSLIISALFKIYFLWNNKSSETLSVLTLLSVSPRTAKPSHLLISVEQMNECNWVLIGIKYLSYWCFYKTIDLLDFNFLSSIFPCKGTIFKGIWLSAFLDLSISTVITSALLDTLLNVMMLYFSKWGSREISKRD